MTKTVFVALIVLFPFYFQPALTNLTSGEFIYNKIKIHIGTDSYNKIQTKFKNGFLPDLESALPRNVIGYVNISEPSISVNEIEATPSFFFRFEKSTNVLQKTVLIYFIDNAETETDFGLAIKKISSHLPLLKLYSNKNKEIVYNNGLRIEFKKKRENDRGYSIEVDIERQNKP
jgi:hypothetical protein